MSDPFRSNVVIPVASEGDARATMRAVLPRLASAGGAGTLLFVVEKAGGAPDKASVEQQEAYAEGVFDAAREAAAGTDVPLDLTVAFGTDVAEAIIDAADDADASAIVFTPRHRSRWTELLTGNVARDLVEESNIPVITLPEGDVDE